MPPTSYRNAEDGFALLDLERWADAADAVRLRAAVYFLGTALVELLDGRPRRIAPRRSATASVGVTRGGLTMADQDWMPGIEHDPGTNAGYHGGRSRLESIVLHYTAGAYGGDYSVGKRGYFNFYCPREMPAVQFAEGDARRGTRANGTTKVPVSRWNAATTPWPTRTTAERPRTDRTLVARSLRRPA